MADTAARLALLARRNEVLRFTIAVAGLDMTNVVMNMQVRLARGTPGAPLIQLSTVTTLSAEGLKFDSVTVSNGIPTSIIRGRINQSTMSDATKVPYAGEQGADTILAYAMQWTLNGDANTRLEGDFIVRDTAYGSDNAPANRPASYGSGQVLAGGSSGSLTFGDQIIQVLISDTALLAPLLAQVAIDRQATLDAATRAETARAGAESAATALSAFTGQRVPAGYSFALIDGSPTGRMALGVSNGMAIFRGALLASGSVVAATFAARTLLANTLNGYTLDTFLPAVSGITNTSPISNPSVSLALDSSKAQRSPVAVQPDGTLEAANLRPRKIDSIAATSFYRETLGRMSPRGGGCFRADMTFGATTGQSNSEGAKGPYVGVGFGQVWDALGMKPKTNTQSTPFALTNSLVAGATTSVGGSDWLGLGYAMKLRGLLILENGLSVTDQPYRQIIANAGYGGTSIAQRSKAGSPVGGLTACYANVIAALTQAVSDAQAGNLPGTLNAGVVKCLDLWNVDGETDAQAGNTGLAYKNTSLQRMSDFATDIKAITNQGETPVELLMQCLTNQAKLQLGNSIRAGTLVGGSGGTNGTFNLILPAPAQLPANSGIQVVGTFNVALGAVTGVNITNVGAGYRGDMALTNAAFANSAGITGASLTLAAETITMPIAMAQRELGAVSAQHVLIGPYYQHFYFADYQHPDGLGSQKTGALMAAASKAIWVDQAGPQADKSRWKALQPTKAERSGKFARLRFDDARGKLAFDAMPWFGMETNYGFDLVDVVTGNPIAIVGVQIIGRKTVLIAAGVVIPAGAIIRYGFKVMTTRTDYYAGGGGNLRDSQGDHLRHEGNRLDNWCIAFSETLA